MIKDKAVTTMDQVRQADPHLAALHEEYWKGLIVNYTAPPSVTLHSYRPWQQDLEDKILNDPYSDREVTFVVDRQGKAGKSWFREQWAEKHGNSYTVGADKRDAISYELSNHVIEKGTPHVVFMDAPRSRSAYVSYTWLEELKNGEIRSPKYKSKNHKLSHRPHVVVMMNAFPRRDNPNKSGLSDDRYTYFVIDEEGQTGKWVHGYRDPDSFTNTPYEEIQETIQPRLPNSLQDSLNRAFKSCFDQTEQKASADTISRSLIDAIKAWSRKPFKR